MTTPEIKNIKNMNVGFDFFKKKTLCPQTGFAKAGVITCASGTQIDSNQYLT